MSVDYRSSLPRLALSAAMVGLFLGPAYAGAQATDLYPRSVVFGHTADIWVDGAETRGELLAVTADTLWWQGEGPAGQRTASSLTEITRLEVRMHDWDAGRIFRWSAIGAGVTSLAMTAACASIDEDTDCWPVPLVTVGAWGLVGLIFGGIVAGTSGRDVLPIPDEVRAYVRFPQGLPEAVGMPSGEL